MKSWLLQRPRSQRVLLSVTASLCSPSESGSLASAVTCQSVPHQAPYEALLLAAPQPVASLFQNKAPQNVIYLACHLTCVVQTFTCELAVPDSLYCQRGAAGVYKAQFSSTECKFLSYAESACFCLDLKRHPKVRNSQTDTYSLNIYICSMNSTHTTSITPVQTMYQRFLCCTQAVPSRTLSLGLRRIR